mgnify:CR=1 FL=1
MILSIGGGLKKDIQTKFYDINTKLNINKNHYLCRLNLQMRMNSISYEAEYYKGIQNMYTRCEYEDMLRKSKNSSQQIQHTMKCWDYWTKQLSRMH